MSNNPVASAASYSNPDQYGEAMALLTTYNWPAGMQQLILENMARIPLRIFICDDSGSMMTNDGHRLINAGRVYRWTELSDTLQFHTNLAKSAHAPSEFRLLNRPKPFKVGVANDENDFRELHKILKEPADGGTPICKHVADAIQTVRGMESQLRENGQKVALIISTDGESSDGNLAEAMKPLEQLPVWVVVRLCTDDKKIVEYWNTIDAQLELDMDVLDDLGGEAEEVYEHNPWLTYGEPMHMLRQFGVPVKEIDLLDESRLTMEQIYKFCGFIYGKNAVVELPHPDIDLNGFIAGVRRLNQSVGKVWCPKVEKERDWIDVSAFDRPATGGGCCVVS